MQSADLLEAQRYGIISRSLMDDLVCWIAHQPRHAS
jgi:hypothetical protein